MSKPAAHKATTKPPIHHRIKHRVKQHVSKRQEAKLAKLEHMLYPRFLPQVRTRRQEISAGIILGIVLLAFVVSIVVVGIPSVRALFSADTKSSSAVVSKPKPIVANQRFLQLSLKNWRYSTGGEAFKAYPGFTFVVVNVEIVQKRATPSWLAPALQSYLTDSTGQQYQLTPDDEIGDPLPARQYEPGEVAKGQLAYEVPLHATNLKWCYDLNSGSAKSNPLCITLR